MKRLAVVAALVGCTVAAAALLWHFRGIVGLFVLSLAVAATLRPMVERQRWLPRSQAVLLTYLVVAGLGLALAAFVANRALSDIQQLADALVVAYDRAWMRWPDGTALEQALAARLPPPDTLYESLAGEPGATMLAGALGVTLGLFDTLANLAVVLVLSLYWSLDQAQFERLWLSVLPTSQRAQARGIWRTMETGVGAYLRSELAQSVLAGVVLGLGYWLMGLQYPALLALVGALAWLIPWLGALLAVIPVMLTGVWALGGSVGLGLGAGLYTLAVLLALEFVVEPRLMARQRRSSLLVVLLALALGQAWGLAGLLAAPPLAAALHILFSQLFPQWIPAGDRRLAGQMADLAQRLAAVRADLAAAGEQAPPEMLSLAERLARLVTSAVEPNGAPSGGPAEAMPAQTSPPPTG
jgi:predicted PurR-regulated permease PerM